jgi:hypothetical protein
MAAARRRREAGRNGVDYSKRQTHYTTFAVSLKEC